MVAPKENPLMEKIVSLCKRRGFIFQSSEIYGGINGFWDYGPLGAELKRNVKELWWRSMVHDRDDVVGLEATIIMHPQIWKASGHVDTFADLMRECPLTKKRVRADQVEPQSGIVYSWSGADDDSYNYFLHESSEFNAIPGWREAVAQHGQERGSSVLNQLVMQHLMIGAGEEKLRLGEAFLEATRQGGLPFARFSVLLPLGKPPEVARKLALQFYRDRGVGRPKLRDEKTTKVENCRDFHPESFAELGPARPFNLMFSTYVGPVEDEENVAYLRPETAQAIFAQFKNVLETSRQKMPFGIAQMGKAFRNEVTPRNFTFRSREFEQMELEFFIRPDEAVEAVTGNVTKVPEAGHPGEPQPSWGWQAWHQYWVEERVRFYEGIGLSRQTLGFHRQTPEELAHYARACVDILFKFPFSKRNEQGELIGEELEGIAARGDFDLAQHEKHSGKPMPVFDEELRGAWAKVSEETKARMRSDFVRYKTEVFIEKKKMSPVDAAAEAETEAKVFFERLSKGQYIPHVIEPSAGVDRLILALICSAYSEDQAPDEKGQLEARIVMRFHPRIAPIKIAVFPLLKNKPELVNKAKEVRDFLRPHMSVFYDDAGAIGRRYRRQDEAGTPFGVTIDFDTLGEKPELKDTVTLRDRDTMKQDRVKISDLLPLLLERIR